MKETFLDPYMLDIGCYDTDDDDDDCCGSNTVTSFMH